MTTVSMVAQGPSGPRQDPHHATRAWDRLTSSAEPPTPTKPAQYRYTHRCLAVLVTFSNYAGFLCTITILLHSWIAALISLIHSTSSFTIVVLFWFNSSPIQVQWGIKLCWEMLWKPVARGFFYIFSSCCPGVASFAKKGLFKINRHDLDGNSSQFYHWWSADYTTCSVSHVKFSPHFMTRVSSLTVHTPLYQSQRSLINSSSLLTNNEINSPFLDIVEINMLMLVLNIPLSLGVRFAHCIMNPLYDDFLG